ncbi:MAG: PQQ-binding-like beta-propeller repeat protein, partial [Lentisphaerae bacterium]|nr:PQQ-binding-like beta-propeller repeat protein [Lentisphaerota bacterium]
DAATGKQLWQAPVDGLAAGLAVANGRLVVSTDKGRLHVFGRGAAGLAAAIAKDARVARGYALVLGKDAAALAYELAQRTEWFIYADESDERQAAMARAGAETLARKRKAVWQLCFRTRD